MNELNCEYVRELYPDVLHGTADAGTSVAVRAHLAGCAECRAEVALIDQLQRVAPEVPAGLHERVVGSLATTRRARFPFKQLALAATVAAALIGGSLLLESTRSAAEPPRAGGLGVITVEAAMVTGTGSLQDLTVEELEQLLGEIES